MTLSHDDSTMNIILVLLLLLLLLLLLSVYIVQRLTDAKDVVVVEMFTKVITYLTHQVCETPERVRLRLS